MFQRQIDALTDKTLVAGFGRADEIWGEFQRAVGCELRFEPLLRQFGAIALDPRKADFERVAIGADGVDMDRVIGLGRLGLNGRRGEIERDAENVGIFYLEQAIGLLDIGLAAQGTTDDLFAKQLRAEGPDA